MFTIFFAKHELLQIASNTSLLLDLCYNLERFAISGIPRLLLASLSASGPLYVHGGEATPDSGRS